MEEHWGYVGVIPSPGSHPLRLLKHSEEAVSAPMESHQQAPASPETLVTLSLGMCFEIPP